MFALHCWDSSCCCCSSSCCYSSSCSYLYIYPSIYLYLCIRICLYVCVYNMSIWICNLTIYSTNFEHQYEWNFWQALTKNLFCLYWITQKDKKVLKYKRIFRNWNYIARILQLLKFSHWLCGLLLPCLELHAMHAKNVFGLITYLSQIATSMSTLISFHRNANNY